MRASRSQSPRSRPLQAQSQRFDPCAAALPAVHPGTALAAALVMFSPQHTILSLGVALSLLAPLARAQSSDPIEGTPTASNGTDATSGWRQDTLLGGHRAVHHGGYGSLLVRASTLNHDPALFVGGRGGWLVGHQLLLGVAGAGQTLTVDSPDAAIDEYPEGKNLEFGYGGAFIAYHFLPEKVLHPTAGVLIGAGGLSLSNRHVHDMDRDTDEFVVNGIFVVEPEASLEVNILDIMRLELTLSYRQALGVDLPGLSNGEVSGLAGGVAILVGRL